MQILNMESHQIKDLELLEKRFNHLFEANDKAKGGSFYLQSKVSTQKLDFFYIYKYYCTVTHITFNY